MIINSYAFAVATPFPDFNKILDFTSAGSEASNTLTVASDTDLEYKILMRNFHATVALNVTLNNDTGNNYGVQYILNNAGTITANRVAVPYIGYCAALDWNELTLLTPVGFIKTAFEYEGTHSSGTTIGRFIMWGRSWNNTAQVTSIKFFPESGNFTSGTRIIVYARRVNV